MNIIDIVVFVLIVILILEIFKHIILRKTAKILIMLIIFLIIFLAISSYLTSNNLVKTENKFIITGAAIFEDIKENIEKNNLINNTKIDVRNIYK